jgi:alpha-N-arabinofuranosidase
MANLRRANGRQDPWRLPYFGVGNENWGCGGNMRAEYYADEYRRYNTFVKTYDGKPIYRIAGGANSTDYRWTEVLMERAASQFDGLSIHNYTLTGGKWPPSGSATNFDESEWFSLVKHACSMDDLIGKHAAVMDKFDHEKRIGMIVDEWGTWLASEPGSTPGFLYQQNALRDAVVAAIHFHIFHRYADRVQMANIAQTVNVLQAMILTDGPRMLRTPTYWVFEMFAVHQGGTVVPVSLETPAYELGENSLPAVSVSATRRADGTVDVSFVNLNPNADHEIRLTGVGELIWARILTAPTMQAHNTFDAPDAVAPAAWEGLTVSEGVLSGTIPSKTVGIASFSA